MILRLKLPRLTATCIVQVGVGTKRRSRDLCPQIKSYKKPMGEDLIAKSWMSLWRLDQNYGYRILESSQNFTRNPNQF